MRSSVFEFIGFAAIFGAAAGLMLLIQQALSMPEVVQALTQFSPWVGANSRALSWVTVGIVFLTTLAIPPILMLNDANDGGTRLGTLGFAVCAALLVPCLGFLVFVGWFSAKHLLV